MCMGCMVVALLGLVLVPHAWAQPDTDLYNFASVPDSANSYSSLVADEFGNLYGTASQGGTYGYGTVFVLCAPGATGPGCNGGATWQQVVLYSFKGLQGGDGANPYSTLIFGGNYAGRAFTLYGTTYNGGNDSCAKVGCGTVFELCAPAAWGGLRRNWLDRTCIVAVHRQQGRLASVCGHHRGQSRHSLWHHRLRRRQRCVQIR